MQTGIIQLFTEMGSQSPALVLHDVVRVVPHDIPGFVEFQCVPPVGPDKSIVVNLSVVAWYSVVETPEGT